jgi:hypothetical protein
MTAVSHDARRRDDRDQNCNCFLSLKVSVVLEPRGDTGAPDTGHDKHLIVAPPTLCAKGVKVAMIRIRNFLITGVVQ